MSANAPAAAWFPDPHDPAQWRWWDGTQWTDDTSPMVQPHEQQPARQQQQEQARQAEAAAKTDRWTVPPLEASLFPGCDGVPGPQPGFVSPRRSLFLRRLPVVLLTSVGALLVTAIGVLFLRVTTSVMALGASMMTDLKRRITDDARDEPWARIMAARGIDGSGMHPRWFEAELMVPVLTEAREVSPRWSSATTLRGMPCFVGELVRTLESEDGLRRHGWYMFAVFEIPPLAAARHPGVSVRRKSLAKVEITKAQPWRGAHRLELESIKVRKALTIDVHPSVDEVSQRELFGPQLVAELGDYPVAWEQRGDLLCVYKPSPLEPGLEFDRFCATAAAISRAYWADQE